jgi:hypothetical protein
MSGVRSILYPFLCLAPDWQFASESKDCALDVTHRS